jgi:CRISPR/Cas system-associated endoribonuclease Cas2
MSVEEEYSNSGKSIEELAKEAMDAIKKSEKNQKLREEDELRAQMAAKEAELANEAKRRIKKKLRELQEKEAKEIAIEEVDDRYLVGWKSLDKLGTEYEGLYNEKYTFRIKKGLYLYHLYVMDKNLMIESWQRSTCTSSSLDNLKEKADKILKESIKKQKEKEQKEKESKDKESKSQ